MRVFVTGAAGFIGSHLVPELIGAGHEVIGSTRSAGGADRLAAMGATPSLGRLEEPEALAACARGADAVVHLAFDHDFARPGGFQESCEQDRRVIAALGAVLAGSTGLLVVTSGVGLGQERPGELAVEAHTNWEDPIPRIATERAAAEQAARGVAVAVMRLPQVHDTARQGLITPLVALAREKGVSAMVGDGANRWPAAAVSDVARLYRLAVEQGEGGAKYHAVAEEGVAMREIAAAIGTGLSVPTVSLEPGAAAGHFGWLAAFAGLDMPASSAWTRARLGWRPTGPALLPDLRAMDYAAVTAP